MDRSSISSAVFEEEVLLVDNGGDVGNVDATVGTTGDDELIPMCQLFLVNLQSESRARTRPDAGTTRRISAKNRRRRMLPNGCC